MVNETCLSGSAANPDVGNCITATTSIGQSVLRMFPSREPQMYSRRTSLRGSSMKSAVCAALGVALISVSSLAGAADLPESRRFHSIDVFQLEYADDVQISPDGNQIVYVRVSYDIMTDRARRNLWIVNADGTNNRPLRSESKNFSSPRWSPDGTRLAYVSAAEGTPQLYVRWMDSGQTALLTNLVQAPGAIAS